MAKYIVAVSGGVDSVALLDMLYKTDQHQLVVAHFDHGIRPDSADDAHLVADLAEKYDLPFVSERAELGPDASEEKARDYRYSFLREVAKAHSARIVTAHHADDVVETIALNLTRGTGWRGLAVLDSDIVRPLLHVNKEFLVQYAKANNLKWHEDSTNSSDKYTRNRLRRRLADIDQETKTKLLNLRDEQVALKKQIEHELASLVGDGPQYDRYFFINLPKESAIECLRHVTNARLTRPQLGRALLAIKTAKPGTIYQAGSGISFSFTTRNFSI